MPKRRRRPTASVSMHATVSDQPQPVASGLAAWIRNQFWNTSLPVLLAAIVGGIVFYIDTTRTQQNHSATLSKLETTITEKTREDIAAREKVREQFLADSKATAAGMAKLNEQTAVMTTVLSG